MPIYRAQIDYFVKNQQAIGELVARLFLSPDSPPVHSLSVHHVGQNKMLGAGVHVDTGREVDMRAELYEITIEFESDLSERDAFKLAHGSFGTLSDFEQLQPVSPIGTPAREAARRRYETSAAYRAEKDRLDEAEEQREAAEIAELAELAKRRLADPTPVDELISLEELAEFLRQGDPDEA